MALACSDDRMRCLPGWRPGFCADVPISIPRDQPCDPSASSGSWAAVPSAAACASLCRACARCAFVSFSTLDLDCSWYAACDAPLRYLATAHCTAAPRELPPPRPSSPPPPPPSPPSSSPLPSPLPSSPPPSSPLRSRPLRVVLVVPLHPPKFGHARNLLRSRRACGQTRAFHLLLLFSSPPDRSRFSREARAARLPLDRAVRALTLPPSSHRPDAYKKLMGVRYAFSKSPPYDFAITPDADALFQSAAEWRPHFAWWAARRAALAAQIEGGPSSAWYVKHARVTAAACRRVGLDARRLGQPTPFLWWNDAPIYERNGFDSFFSRIDWSLLTPALNRSADPLDPSGYEHASYVCYKALVEKWELLRLYRMMERASSDEQYCLSQQLNYSFLWSRDQNPDRLLLFHADRARFPRVTSLCGQPLTLEGPFHIERLDT
ncbi:hypothetical protein AB1Y20_013437 [Prymnesium parvum]|uniref:Protein xylosyltransferase n=1 Tax=Prymnesium parvum TaxID=97485 RepID=A0AB34IFV2_PRYPA